MDFRTDMAGGKSLESAAGMSREEGRILKQNFDPRRESEQVKSAKHVEAFLNGLVAVSPKAVVFTGFAAQLKTKATTPDTIPHFASKFCEQVGSNLADNEKCKIFHERLAFSSEECALLEERTRGQSSSQEWIEQRKGRVTASQVHRVTHKVDVMVKKRQATVTPLLDLLINGGGNLSTLPAIQWGNESETRAIQEFKTKLEPHHDNLVFLPAGLFVKKQKPYIDAIPDGIVVCDCHGKSVLEVKSSFKLKGLNAKEHFKSTDFLQEENGSITLKQTHAYFSQVQCEMAVTELENCFFFVFPLAMGTL
ncbi:Jade1-like protein [Elysia marginata]|uniref:Jade1-like protein n=1 Tax=Elysia marginata TaxID=1093978 RepID=A0AAV4I6V8_9GAST|nr:Jade1-like protein [Elysia marginata]